MSWLYTYGHKENIHDIIMASIYLFINGTSITLSLMRTLKRMMFWYELLGWQAAARPELAEAGWLLCVEVFMGSMSPRSTESGDKDRKSSSRSWFSLTRDTIWVKVVWDFFFRARRERHSFLCCDCSLESNLSVWGATGWFSLDPESDRGRLVPRVTKTSMDTRFRFAFGEGGMSSISQSSGRTSSSAIRAGPSCSLADWLAAGLSGTPRDLAPMFSIACL